MLKKIPLHKDETGTLAALSLSELPFMPKRVFWVYGSEHIRGMHAHKKTNQFIVCVTGNISVRLHNGKSWINADLVFEGDCRYVPAMIWAEITFFNPEDVLLVFADTEYEPDDYIRDFEEFKSLII
jgi:dTDP-4-dehydrorhamnose 3,5-epimerase-like enzyme